MLGRKIGWGILGLLGFVGTALIGPECLAGSDYVLPYPGIMPGHQLYRLEQLVDRLYGYWAFGNFAQYRYHLGLADKKLVEAKILFEYQQYLLAVGALRESSDHFLQAANYLDKASKEGKIVIQKKTVLMSAGLKHREVLNQLLNQVPEDFVWRPEKKGATNLNLKSEIETAIRLKNLAIGK